MNLEKTIAIKLKSGTSVVFSLLWLTIKYALVRLTFVSSPVSFNASYEVEHNLLSTHASLAIRWLVKDRLPIARIPSLVKGYSDEPFVGKKCFGTMCLWRIDWCSWHLIATLYFAGVGMASKAHASSSLPLFKWCNSSHDFVQRCCNFLPYWDDYINQIAH